MSYGKDNKSLDVKTYDRDSDHSGHKKYRADTVHREVDDSDRSDDRNYGRTERYTTRESKQYVADNDDRNKECSNDAKSIIRKETSLNEKSSLNNSSGGDIKVTTSIGKEKNKKSDKERKRKRSSKEKKSHKKDKKGKEKSKKARSSHGSGNESSSDESSSSSDSDDDAPRSSITGKKIRLQRELSLEDRLMEAEREAKRFYMNSQY